MSLKKLSLAIGFSLFIGYNNIALSEVCIGNCGISGADGVVTLPPSGATSYGWISTDFGLNGIGSLPGYTSGTTNGSILVSDPFFAATGAVVEFYFNYVTSDGSGYVDYAWSKLQGATSDNVIFTARTKPSGNIVPGQDLPGVTANLSSSNVAITPGAPNWSPLGSSSGTCFSTGCGYTGWVKSTYTVTESGTYTLAFGVVNSQDTLYQSGLAFQGLTLNGNIIGNGSSADNALLPSEIGENGSFNFIFTPLSSMQPVFIDPIIATGYDYQIMDGTNLITSVILPILPEDTDGYEIYLLGDTSPTGLLGTVLGGVTFNFETPLSGFTVLDINTDALLDPSNPTAFVTGLTFLDTSLVSMSQTPITAFVAAVPEPSTYALLLAGFGVMAGATRRKNRASA